MPCRGPDDDWNGNSIGPSKKTNAYTIEIDALKAELAKVTAIACGMTRAMELTRQDFNFDPFDSVNWNEMGVSREEFSAWWTEHKKEDAERVEREKAAALAKLTPAERTLLGL
jgi:hypothetical protein